MPFFSSIPADCHPDVSAVISVLLDLGLQKPRENHTQPGVAGSHLNMSDGYALGICSVLSLVTDIFGVDTGFMMDFKFLTMDLRWI
jgi:hypothetical protein